MAPRLRRSAVIDDPIVAEVRNARDEYARRFNYDLDAICKDLISIRQKRRLISA
jgi:hypothetical protein